jgi:hypothetical protein
VTDTSTSPRTNRHPAPCRKCRREVGAGEGRLLNTNYGRNIRAAYTGREVAARWVVECLDRAACAERAANLPEALERKAKAAAADEARRLEVEAKLADHLRRHPEVPIDLGLGGARREAEMPDGTILKWRKVKAGVRVVFGEAFDLDYRSAVEARLAIRQSWVETARRLEAARVHALPLPAPGTIYERQYRMGGRYYWAGGRLTSIVGDHSDRVFPLVHSTGRSIFLGLVHVPHFGEAAMCAEEMSDGSWAGYQDIVHVVKRYANGEGVQ